MSHFLRYFNLRLLHFSFSLLPTSSSYFHSYFPRIPPMAAPAAAAARLRAIAAPSPMSAHLAFMAAT